MIPFLDEACREYSDLQAEILQHIHSEKYIYVNADCPVCSGSGKIKVDGKTVECTSCKGSGRAASISNYNTYLVDAAKVGENALPTPPMGYVQKSTEIAKLQDERVKSHIYSALSTLNMEFLAQSPLNQSGTAKEVDKDELNNFVNSIAEDLVNAMDFIYKSICDYRYSVLYPNNEQREKLLPKINVPTKYDILSGDYLINEIKAAKESGISNSIKKALEIEYTNKKFNTMPELSEYNRLCFELNPFYGLTEDEKMTRLSSNGISVLDYIVSSNIDMFVRRAIEENKTFSELDFAKQVETMQKYAIEKQSDINKNVVNYAASGIN